jgi:phage terminase large subunit-like protein
MLCGESGILSVARLDFMPTWEPSKRKVTWPNGAQALSISSEEPSQLRGVQFHYAWADELAAWRTERGIPPAWDQLQFTMRLGQTPQVLVTTTPRPTKIIRMLLESPFTAVTRGRTQDNAANLAPAFMEQIEARYAGTRLGRQELDGVVLDDAPGALWKRDQIDTDRVQSHPPLARVVVAIDPAATSGEESDQTGIVVAGVSHTGEGYLLEDLTGTYTPDAWARVAIGAYERHQADRIVAEVNHGGEMIEKVVRSVAKDLGVTPAYRAVRASRGKATRAEPISALCEQHRIHHVGEFLELDDCLCTWDPALSSDSPDRLDAYVWAFTDLKIGPKPSSARIEALPPPSRSW